VHALQDLGGPRAIALLKRVLESDPDTRVRNDAERALERVGAGRNVR